MSTWMEKLEGKFEEGLDAARVAIRAKAGESQTLCEPSSPYWLDLRQRAKLLEASLEGIGDEVKEFLSLSGWSAKEQSKDGQLDLEVHQEDAHEDAVDAEWTEEPKALPPAPEDPKTPARQIIAELDRLGAFDVHLKTVFTNDLGHWAHLGKHTDVVDTLTVDEVLGVLREQTDTGMKATWKALKAAAKAKEPPGRPAGEPAKRRKSKPTWRDRCEDPIEAFNAELDRLGVLSEVTFEFPGPHDTNDDYGETVRFIQHGAEPETVDLPIGAALHQLRMLNKVGLETLWEVLFTWEDDLEKGIYRWDDAKARWVKCRKKKAS